MCVGSSAPSSTWKEWPQPHEDEAFGFSILKPDSWSPFMKSIVAPWRYGMLNGSTTTVTPSSTSSRSPSAAWVSNPRPYWKPEQPPPWIATRSTIVSPSGSSAISSRIFSAAAGVIESSVSVGRSVISMPLIVAEPRRALHRSPPNFVTPVSR